MRFVVVAGLLCALLVGLGYTYGQESSIPTFLTAPVERGSISTLVKASGTIESVVSVDVSSQLSGRIAEVFVNFNDTITAGQPIAQIDQEIFAARVNEAGAALRVARATAQVEKAALERAKVAVVNAQTAEKLAQAQSAANKARQDELERDLLRKLELARTGSGTERDLSQVRALRDAGAADLRASLEQIQLQAEAIAIAEAERHMAEANLENAQAVVEQRQAALDQAGLDLNRTVLRAPIDGIIIKRDVNPGQTVAVSLEAKTLFKIANDLREMEVHGRIDEADIGRISESNLQRTGCADPQGSRGRAKRRHLYDNRVRTKSGPFTVAGNDCAASDRGEYYRRDSQNSQPSAALPARWRRCCVWSPECKPSRFLQGVRDGVAGRRRRATEPGCREARRERRRQRSPIGGRA